MINKILNKIFLILGDNKIWVKIYEEDILFYFFKKIIKIGTKKYYFYLDIQYFFNAIITFIVFILFWKYDIKIFTDIFINYIENEILYIFLLCFIYFVYLIRLFYKKNGKAIFQKNIINLLSLLSNILILIYILKLNILIIIYYDLFLYLYFYMLFMFNINVYLLLWKGYLDFVTDFMIYPWIFLLLCSIIIYFKLERYFWLFSYMEVYFFIDVEELEIREENW